MIVLWRWEVKDPDRRSGWRLLTWRMAEDDAARWAATHGAEMRKVENNREDREDREYDPAAFIRTQLADTLASCPSRRSGIFVGIDEGMNDETHIGALCGRLLADRVIKQMAPLWWELRKKDNGQLVALPGSSKPSPVFKMDVGRAVPGVSWPDERVLASLVFHFVLWDRLCLLTGNTANDKNGLRQILETEVGPALHDLGPSPLGLLVLSPSTGASMEDYAAAVEARLRSGGVTPGYQWERVGTAARRGP